MIREPRTDSKTVLHCTQYSLSYKDIIIYIIHKQSAAVAFIALTVLTPEGHIACLIHVVAPLSSLILVT